MHTNTWKQAEREIASRMGGTRIPINGRKGPDCDVPYFALEVKHGHQIPKRVQEWMDQAEVAAGVNDDPRPPAIAMHPHGADYGETIIAFRLKDLALLEQLIRTERYVQEDAHVLPSEIWPYETEQATGESRHETGSAAEVERPITLEERYIRRPAQQVG